MNKLSFFDDSGNNNNTSDIIIVQGDNENDNIAVSLNDNENKLLHSPDTVSSSPLQIKELKPLNYPEYISICNKVYNVSRHNK